MNPGPQPVETIATGIPHLDDILGGGLRRRSTTVVIGAPGTGKTVLAQQLAFHRASLGEPALYLTGYSETHDKLLAHNRGFTFFRPDAIGHSIHFGSLADLLKRGGEETEDAILTTARNHRAALVVLDGFQSMRAALADAQAIAHFVYSLGAKLALVDAALVVIIEGDLSETSRYPELFVADVILVLRHALVDRRKWRLVEVMKARGAPALEGLHPFVIDQDGITIYPRLESCVEATAPSWASGRASLGVPDIDRMTGGGLTRGTVTLVAGSPGVGKTLLALHFSAAGAAEGEPVLFLGFMESVAQLREKAVMFGLDLSAAESSGLLRFLVLPAFDLEADMVADVVRQDVQARGVRRLVLDSAAEVQRGLASEERTANFLAALVGYLRGHEVTSYFTLDIPSLLRPAVEFIGTPASVLAENLLLLRQVEYGNHLHRILSVLKMRFSNYEEAIQEFGIEQGKGIRILGPAPLGEGLLTGIARPLQEELRETES